VLVSLRTARILRLERTRDCGPARSRSGTASPSSAIAPPNHACHRARWTEICHGLLLLVWDERSDALRLYPSARPGEQGDGPRPGWSVTHPNGGPNGHLASRICSARKMGTAPAVGGPRPAHPSRRERRPPERAAAIRPPHEAFARPRLALDKCRLQGDRASGREAPMSDRRRSQRASRHARRSAKGAGSCVATRSLAAQLTRGS
jgi:hypothetical protein